jgi:hypothetical protein
MSDMNDEGLLVSIVELIVEGRATDLAEHFCENLSGMAICSVFVVFLRAFHPFRLGQ